VNGNILITGSLIQFQNDILNILIYSPNGGTISLFNITMMTMNISVPNAINAYITYFVLCNVIISNFTFKSKSNKFVFYLFFSNSVSTRFFYSDQSNSTFINCSFTNLYLVTSDSYIHYDQNVKVVNNHTSTIINMLFNNVTWNSGLLAKVSIGIVQSADRLGTFFLQNLTFLAMNLPSRIYLSIYSPFFVIISITNY